MFTKFFYMLVSSELLVSITSPGFTALNLPVSEIAKCIARGSLLLFYKNCIVYYNVYCDCVPFKGKHIASFVLISCCISDVITCPSMSLS